MTAYCPPTSQVPNGKFIAAGLSSLGILTLACDVKVYFSDTAIDVFLVKACLTGTEAIIAVLYSNVRENYVVSI